MSEPIQIENYTQDLNAWNATRNVGGIKRAPGSMSQRALHRMIREAKRDYLDGFGIDWSQYGAPKVVFMDMLTAHIEWTHLTSGREIHLTNVWFEKRTGEILQAGTQYGSLTL